MPDIINLTCPSCGGKLQITNDIERFACGYCGNEQIIQRSGGIVTITPVVEGLREVKKGVDKTASELAIVRLKGEIFALFAQREEASKGYAITTWIITWLILFGAVFLGTLWILAMVRSSISAEWVSEWIMRIIIFLCPLVVASFFTVKVLNGLAQPRKDRIAPIDNMIAQKQQELNKHQEIVTGK